MELLGRYLTGAIETAASEHSKIMIAQEIGESFRCIVVSCTANSEWLEESTEEEWSTFALSGMDAQSHITQIKELILSEGTPTDCRRMQGELWEEYSRISQRNAQSVLSDLPPDTFLPDIKIDAQNRRVERNGYPPADFGRKFKTWNVFRKVYETGSNGISRNELMQAVWPNGGTSNNADQQKKDANDILEAVRIEIKPDNRGIWRISEL